jgi:hypothetical protein
MLKEQKMVHTLYYMATAHCSCHLTEHKTGVVTIPQDMVIIFSSVYFQSCIKHVMTLYGQVPDYTVS